MHPGRKSEERSIWSIYTVYILISYNSIIVSDTSKRGKNKDVLKENVVFLLSWNPLEAPKRGSPAHSSGIPVGAGNDCWKFRNSALGKSSCLFSKKDTPTKSHYQVVALTHIEKVRIYIIGPFPTKLSGGNTSKTSVEPLDDTGFGCQARFTFLAPIPIDPNLKESTKPVMLRPVFSDHFGTIYGKKYSVPFS